MREREDEFVHDSINPHRATDQLECRIVRVAVDEVTEVEMTQASSPDASRHLSPGGQRNSMKCSLFGVYCTVGTWFTYGS